MCDNLFLAPLARRTMLDIIAIGLCVVCLGWLWATRQALAQAKTELINEKEGLEATFSEKIETGITQLKDYIEDTTEEVGDAMDSMDVMEAMKAQMMSQVYSLIFGLIQKKFGGPEFSPAQIEGVPNED